ncbi:MAG: pseudouridine synthase [Bermanella sp.]
MSQLILFNKPFRVLSQFTCTEGGKDTLASYIDQPNVYAAGRLDYDSEGLLLLTDNGALQHRIAHPKHKSDKTYWAQVEGIPSDAAIETLKAGVSLKDGVTLPAKIKVIDEPKLWERDPPIRQRASSPTAWLEIIIHEGKNRQVRRMTAAVGLPTLRLIRASIGEWSLEDLQPGQYKALELKDEPTSRIKGKPPYPAKHKFAKMRQPKKRP